MKLIFLTIVALFFVNMVNGQATRSELSQLGIFNPEDNGQAKIYINQDNQLKEILIGKAHVEKEYNVWRVQIYMGSGKNSRGVASSVENTFRTKYPGVDTDKIYHSPYFKVQVGNFKTRIEAESLKRKVLSDFPNCFVVSVTNKVKVNHE